MNIAQTLLVFGYSAFIFVCGGFAGYAIYGIINESRARREWQDFNARIERESKIPSYLTPTPKLKNAERLMREYRDTHILVNGVELKGHIQ